MFTFKFKQAGSLHKPRRITYMFLVSDVVEYVCDTEDTEIVKPLQHFIGGFPNIPNIKR